MDKTYDQRGYTLTEAYFGVDNEPLPVEVWLSQVTPCGLGEQLGLRVGDILKTYNGKEVTSAAPFTSGRRAEPRDGPARELVVLRDGKALRIMLSPGLLDIVLTTRVRTAEKQ